MPHAQKQDFVFRRNGRIRDSSVGIATRYGPGIEFRWGRDFPYLSRPVLKLTQPPIHWVLGLSRG